MPRECDPEIGSKHVVGRNKNTVNGNGTGGIIRIIFIAVVLLECYRSVVNSLRHFKGVFKCLFEVIALKRRELVPLNSSGLSFHSLQRKGRCEINISCVEMREATCLQVFKNCRS
jgi:hypothetical protein